MFDNIIAQNGIVRILKSELENQTLPQALLFFGPDYSGKLSTALELSRILTCEQLRGDWSCPCTACEKHRRLTYSSLLILGPRYFEEEINASADVLLRYPRRSSQYLFVRAVRKLLKRFEPVLWEGDESKSLKVFELKQEIEEDLDIISPPNKIEVIKDIDKMIKEIISKSLKLSSHINKKTIPIAQIRRIIYWSHLSHQNEKKIVIIENTDKMMDASRNALLKILEEPPLNVYYILTATKKSKIIQTILSRLRPYYFPERDRESQEEVLKKIFHEENSEYKDIKNYFLAWRNININTMDNISNEILDYICNDDQTVLFTELNEFQPVTSSTENLKIFLEQFVKNMEKRLKECNEDRRIKPDIIDKWLDIINQKLVSLELLNQNPSLVLESLLYRLKEVK